MLYYIFVLSLWQHSVEVAVAMASLPSCTCRVLSGTTFRSGARGEMRSPWPRTISLCMPSSMVGITGSSISQLQVSCLPRHHPLCARQHRSHVACISTVSEEICVQEEISPVMPTSFEVHQLLMELCDETSIAELQLKVGSFRLNVKRDVGKIKSASPAQPVAPPPVPSKPMVDLLPTPSSAPTKPSSASGLISSLSKPLSSTWALLESAADEGLLFVKSPKVGFFRKGRVARGKSGPPLLEEGQVIKEGHVVCYLEQLGTQQPVESEISGEVVKVLWEDGEPVGYGDPLIAIRPSFPGIKKLT